MHYKLNYAHTVKDVEVSKSSKNLVILLKWMIMHGIFWCHELVAIMMSLQRSGNKNIPVYKWHKCFCNGSVCVNDNPCCWRPSPSTNDRNMKHVHSLWEVANKWRYQWKYEYQQEAFTVFFTNIWKCHYLCPLCLKNANIKKHERLLLENYSLWLIKMLISLNIIT
jgi:hypothetical protein